MFDMYDPFNVVFESAPDRQSALDTICECCKDSCNPIKVKVTLEVQ